MPPAYYNSITSDDERSEGEGYAFRSHDARRRRDGSAYPGHDSSQRTRRDSFESCYRHSLSPRNSRGREKPNYASDSDSRYFSDEPSRRSWRQETSGDSKNHSTGESFNYGRQRSPGSKYHSSEPSAKERGSRPFEYGRQRSPGSTYRFSEQRPKEQSSNSFGYGRQRSPGSKYRSSGPSPRKPTEKYFDYGRQRSPDSKYRFQGSRQEQREPAYFCWQCQQSFTNSESRSKHLKSSLMHVMCTVCDDDHDFKTSRKLHSHCRSMHYSVWCEICCETFACNADKKAHFEAMHFLCKPCKRWFPTSLERGEHYEISDKHVKDYCNICETIFPDLRAHTADHLARRKPRGYTEKSRTYSYRSNTRRDYRSQDDPHTPPRETPSRSIPRPPSGGIHYTTLGIDSSASHEQVVQAAKKRRIETHPDRLKRRLGLTTRELERIDEEAGTVGNAADILSSPALRAEYDKAVGSGAQR